jgi:hypothetical protein
MKLKIVSEKKFTAIVKLTAKDLYRAFLNRAAINGGHLSLTSDDKHIVRVCDLGDDLRSLTTYLFLDCNNETGIKNRTAYLQMLMDRYPIQYFIDDEKIRNRIDHIPSPSVTLMIEFSDKSTVVVYTANQ